MGNRFICMTKKEVKENGSRSKRMGRSQRKLLAEEEYLHKQALSMALHQHQLSQRFEGSMSRRIGSTSSRRRNLPDDPLSNEKQALDFLEKMITKKFILIHGEGFGAWCWYKTIALLEESGLLTTALDLTGSGIDLTDTNSIATLAEYSKPLIDHLQSLVLKKNVMHYIMSVPGLVCSLQDVALAMVSMRPIPLGPIMEKVSLSPEKYGTGRRFYIQTLDDRALSPFFSKPQSLHKILVEIAQIP